MLGQLTVGSGKLAELTVTTGEEFVKGWKFAAQLNLDHFVLAAKHRAQPNWLVASYFALKFKERSHLDLHTQIDLTDRTKVNALWRINKEDTPLVYIGASHKLEDGARFKGRLDHLGELALHYSRELAPNVLGEVSLIYDLQQQRMLRSKPLPFGIGFRFDF